MKSSNFSGESVSTSAMIAVGIIFIPLVIPSYLDIFSTTFLSKPLTDSITSLLFIFNPPTSIRPLISVFSAFQYYCESTNACILSNILSKVTSASALCSLIWFSRISSSESISCQLFLISSLAPS